jgi:ABC-type multidrug transport system ATPase subunit
MSDRSTPAIRTVGLTKRYGERAALAPLDVSIASGERVSLVGHNGSGKTTLVRMLAGLLDPTAGEATVGGHTAGSIEARDTLSYLADTPVFYDDLSVREHLEFIARLHGADEWQHRADELLERLGIADRADDLPVTFSRGLKQKAAIAIAFVRPFSVLVVDEPFVGLDRAGRAALLELLAVAHEQGSTLLVASHELTTVTASDRLVALRDGALVFNGQPADADLDDLVAH